LVGRCGSPPALTDGDFDVLATMSSGGGIIDRLRYTADGKPRLEHRADNNGDVIVDSADSGPFLDEYSDPEPVNGQLSRTASLP
jgi:hypothetical protein